MKHKYILPLVIDQRKSHFLDLRSNRDSVSPDPESFVVQLPEGNISEVILCSINRSQVLQTLVNGTSDVSFTNMDISTLFSNGGQELTITLSEAKNSTAAVFTPATFSVENDMSLMVKMEDGKIKIIFSTGGMGDMLSNKKITLTFRYLSGDSINYAGSVSVFLAHKANIIQCGLDFGSEASQMREDFKSNRQYPIFNMMYDNNGGVDPKKKYVQYDSNDNLYKSIFFVKTELNNIDNIDFINDKKDEIKLLTLETELGDKFFESWTQMPNLKLVHKHADFLSHITFRAKRRTGIRQVGLHDVKDTIYKSILRELISSYLHETIQDLKRKYYVRFTLLVPNIYDIDNAKESREIIKKIILDLNKQLDNCIAGAEVSTLSESDASFLGHYKTTANLSPGESYYIIIDCGKGTTDFSIIKSDTQANEITPIYRNGVAGAGNLISFGFLEAAVHFLIQNATNRKNAQAALTQFFTAAEGASYLGRELFTVIEEWKKKYKSELSEVSIKQQWNDQRTGAISLKNLFDSPSISSNNLLTLLKSCQTSYDWNGYIDEKIQTISQYVVQNIHKVINNLPKGSKCGGILLTGRGFLFTPLQDSIVTELRKNKMLASVKIEKPLIETQLKTVCLEGVFRKNFIVNNDMVGIPIEFNPMQVNNATQIDNKIAKAMGSIGTLLRKVVMGDTDIYNAKTNSFSISRGDLTNKKFLLGSSTYSVNHGGLMAQGDDYTAELIFTRDGFSVRVKDDTDKIIRILDLVSDDAINVDVPDNIIRSLFPGKIDANLIRPLKGDFVDDFDALMPS